MLRDRDRQTERHRQKEIERPVALELYCYAQICSIGCLTPFIKKPDRHLWVIFLAARAP